MAELIQYSKSYRARCNSIQGALVVTVLHCRVAGSIAIARPAMALTLARSFGVTAHRPTPISSALLRKLLPLSNPRTYSLSVPYLCFLSLSPSFAIALLLEAKDQQDRISPEIRNSLFVNIQFLRPSCFRMASNNHRLLPH